MNSFTLYLSLRPSLLNPPKSKWSSQTQTECLQMTQSYNSVVNNTTEHAALQEDLERLNKWAVTWQLPFNKDKCNCNCKVVHYGRKNPGYDYRLSRQETVLSDIVTSQSGKPAHEGPPPSLKRGVPLMRVRSLCITIYRWKNHFCKKLQWCLWLRFMYPLSFHQFIEISIFALKFFFVKHFNVAPPVKLCAPAGLPARRRRNYRAN